MLAGSLFTSFGFWLLLGLALFISEFFVPGLIAAFFGIGAVVVGLLTWMGVIDTLPIQLLTFAVISVVALFALRSHFNNWLRGGVSDRSEGYSQDDGLVGSRVFVATDFANGTGAVQLNGAKWDAESDEPLKAGDAAWVTRHSGIVLTVSGRQPTSSHTSQGA
ncbi:NfeD family protein [Halopseudomonas nanhaiensis]|uniref:NfeD family protein n=1 Tax=Halopseudomonas nanhaiensis TaxID=2830842 RepID=UPI001CBCBB5C|nr:NfeD family protein [Halopseudomonas nanhaiensis]UAW98559.1 NfeD family protein [Halopseudomonas nanhaiensis]